MVCVTSSTATLNIHQLLKRDLVSMVSDTMIPQDRKLNGFDRNWFVTASEKNKKKKKSLDVVPEEFQ